MKDVTDLAFRLVCRKFGTGMVYTELVSSDALIRSVNRTTQKLTVYDEEHPVTIQMYGRDTETMVGIVRIIRGAQPDVLGINFGCPVREVAGKGAGAGVLQNIPKILEVTHTVVNTVKIPVTVKTRLGWDADHKIITDLAGQLQDCGVAALAIHGRTQAQMYTGEAGWALIGEVENNPRMHIPIIGNGDVASATGAKECSKRYGVDATMIERGSIGRPWIFREVKYYLGIGEELLQESFEWYLNVLREEVLNGVARLDERRGTIHIRRHLAAAPLFRGIPNSRETRIAILRIESVGKLFRIFSGLHPIT